MSTLQRIGNIIILIFLILIFVFSISYAAKLKVKVGDVVPDFVLTDLKNTRIYINDFRDKVIFLNYISLGLGEEQTKNLVKVYDLYKEKNVEFITIVADDAYTDKDISKFMEEHQVEWIILRDFNWGVLKAKFIQGNIATFPMNLILDKEGIITCIKYGMGEEDIKKELDKVLQTDK